MSFTIDGIVSGFDTTTIIESLLGFQQTQLDTFNSRKAEIATQQSAFKGIEAQLLTLQNTLGRLNRASSSVFDVQQAVSSDPEIIQAASSSSAANGVYNMTVDQLAAAHQIGSQGFDALSSEIAKGEISFRTGDRPEQTITVDSSNNTLSGLADAINEEVDGVNAGVIYDQGSDSYRLLLTSEHTGTANSIEVTNNFSGGSATEPDFSGPAVQEARDALITLGSGSGAITSSYSSNQVEDLIENVSLNLLSADPGKTVSINITSDTGPATEAITDFVNQFNSIMEFIDNQTQFNPETNQASALLGNRSVNELRDELRQLVIDTVPGLEGSANRLAAIGVDINTRGRLELDSAKLEKAFTGGIDGVDPVEIRNLFGLNGRTDHAGIEFITGGSRTQDSETAYGINITQAARQASITGSQAPSATTVITADNNEIQITLDGTVSETLTLEEGEYTAEELAAHLESVINSSSELGAHDVEVSSNGTGGTLEINSTTYGSQSKISSISGSAASILGFDGTESDEGLDVAGFFIVDGKQESAVGKGRVLVGDSDNENTADLQIRVSLTDDQVKKTVQEGEVLVTRGVSGRLDQLINQILDSETGTLKSINDDFEQRIQSIDDSIERVQKITESKRDYLIAEFTALESIISELRTTGDFLTQQLASLSSNNK